MKTLKPLLAATALVALITPMGYAASSPYPTETTTPLEGSECTTSWSLVDGVPTYKIVKNGHTTTTTSQQIYLQLLVLLCGPSPSQSQ